MKPLCPVCRQLLGTVAVLGAGSGGALKVQCRNRVSRTAHGHTRLERCGARLSLEVRDGRLVAERIPSGASRVLPGLGASGSRATPVSG